MRALTELSKQPEGQSRTKALAGAGGDLSGAVAEPPSGHDALTQDRSTQTP